ncbi:Glycosyltransferase [Lactococcus lactis subsp. lactis]|uniref:Glycosyltransferase n=1 Tax=Lactococcus lactis subsp. lactis TaxID=1360 RepID=A0A0V8CPF5_LACLL|nr:glycosyltransferase family 2 protein [Lactococcus lactis]KSU03007.1 Glycosyltransferase [Lactococcus lactis subsp. lactis]
MDKNKLQKEFETYNYLDNQKWKEEIPSYKVFKSDTIFEEIKVSVVIANYNNEPYLEKMMNALVNQTIGIETLQIIFVDDCSTDNSKEVIEGYLAKYPNIEFYQFDRNTGGAHTPRNLGILKARGKYLVILDADDWYELDALKSMSDLLDESQDKMVVGGIVQVNDHHVSAKSIAYYAEGKQINRNIQDLPYEFYEFLGPQGIMVLTSLVLENRLHFVNQRVADDVLFFYQCLRISNKISQLPQKTTYLNRISENNSLSKTINKDFMISWLRALAFVNQNFPNDISKERFLARRLDWLVLDFALRRNIGYKFGIERLKDFKNSLNKYLGDLTFNPQKYFKEEARKIAWSDLRQRHFLHLYLFVNWHSHRESLKIKKKINNLYYFVFPGNILPKIPINVRASAYKMHIENNFSVFEIEVLTNEEINNFEFHAVNDPFKSIKAQEVIKKDNKFIVKFSRKELENLSENYGLHVISNIYHDHIVEISKVTNEKTNVI